MFTINVMRKVVLLVHNVRSSHNVGSLLRTADGLGIDKVYLTGYSPYPLAPGDTRLPHIAAKTTRQIAKTALGAEKSVKWQHEPDINKVLDELKHKSYEIAALEQAPGAIPLHKFKPPLKTALIVGNEIDGLNPEVLAFCSRVIDIPMRGQKESFNVAAAAAMALYYLRYIA